MPKFNKFAKKFKFRISPITKELADTIGIEFDPTMVTLEKYDYGTEQWKTEGLIDNLEYAEKSILIMIEAFKRHAQEDNTAARVEYEVTQESRKEVYELNVKQKRGK